MTVELERVGLDYLETAPQQVTVTQLFTTTPERLFEVFADEQAWPKWVPVIKQVEWTSELPIREGTTRTVHMAGAMVGYEEFLAWQPGTRMAFRFNQMAKPGISAFLEDYQVRDLGNGTIELSWTMAMTPTGISAKTFPLAKPAIRAGLKYSLKRLRSYVESL